MATWADIQSWDHNAIIEAEDLIEGEVREAREIIADLEHAANDIRSVGEAPDQMRQRLTEIQDKLDSRLNELTEYALATAELHGYVSRVVAIRESAYEVAAELNYQIPEDGTIVNRGATREEPSPSEVLKYVDLSACISEAVKLATEAEETVGPRYQALANGQYVLAEGRHSESAGLANDADPSWTPEQVSVWWRLLSDSERERSSTRIPRSTATWMASTWPREPRQMSLCSWGPRTRRDSTSPEVGCWGKPSETSRTQKKRLPGHRERAHWARSTLLSSSRRGMTPRSA